MSSSTVPLSEISAFITKGATPTTYGYKWEADGVPFLRSECVSADGLDMSESMFISVQADQALRRSRLLDGDLLITITGNVGRVVRLTGMPKANINQHIARVRVSSPAFVPAFVYHYLSQSSVREYFESITTGQAYPQLSLAQIRDAQIPLIPVNEQRSIADALDAAEDQIINLKNLIVKKLHVKQGMMQELLTGRTRLHGFTRDWTETVLRDVLKFQPGFPFSSSFFTDSPSGRRIVRNRDLRSGDSKVYYEGSFPPQYLLSAGDVLIGMDGEFEPVVWRQDGALLNQRVGRLLLSKHVDGTFLAYALQVPLTEIQNGTGATTVKHLSHSDVESISMMLPTKCEQSAIAEALQDADSEIRALERRLESARAVKVGMMQELLTGRTRLPLTGEA